MCACDKSPAHRTAIIRYDAVAHKAAANRGRTYVRRLADSENIRCACARARFQLFSDHLVVRTVPGDCTLETPGVFFLLHLCVAFCARRTRIEFHSLHARAPTKPSYIYNVILLERCAASGCCSGGHLKCGSSAGVEAPGERCMPHVCVSVWVHLTLHWMEANATQKKPWSNRTESKKKPTHTRKRIRPVHPHTHT